MSTGEYVNGGGMSLHAPSIIEMGKEAFIAFYLDKITFIQDEPERLKYLTSKYNECVELMNPPRYKTIINDGKIDLETTEPEAQGNEVHEKRTSKTRKSTEKKE